MRTQNIAIVIVYGTLLLASGAFLFGCDDSATSPAARETDESLTAPLTTTAIGAWEADTAIAIPTSVGIAITPTLAVSDTLRADFSFTAALRIRDLFEGNDVVGPVYVRTGVWSAPGDSLLILTPTSCLQGDTATVMGVSGLPFSSTAGLFVANPLVPVPCGPADTVRTRPRTSGHWAVPMNVNLGDIASGRWTLDFVRQP